MFGTFAYVWFIKGICKAAVISSGCDDIATEVETFGPSHWYCATASCQYHTRTQSRAVGSGLRQCKVSFQMGIFLWLSKIAPSFLCLLFQTISVTIQLLTLCRSIFANERAQILEPLMSSRFWRSTVHVWSLVCVHRLLGCLQD